MIERSNEIFVVIDSMNMAGYDLEEIIRMNMFFPFGTVFNSDESIFCCRVASSKKADRLVKKLDRLIERGAI